MFWNILLIITWILSSVAFHALLDLPLLQNLVTGLMAVLPKTLGAREDVVGFAPFVLGGALFHFPTFRQ